MATDPYAAIRRLPSGAFVSTTIPAEQRFRSGNPNRQDQQAVMQVGAEDKTLWNVNPDFFGEGNTGRFGPFQSKWNKVTDLGNGLFEAVVQVPGEDKYSQASVLYRANPATGEYEMVGTPNQFRQQSSNSQVGQALGTVASFVGGAALAPGLAGALGGGALGGAGAGALIGGTGALASGSDSEGALKAALAGGISGGIGGYLNEPATAAGNASSGASSGAASSAPTQNVGIWGPTSSPITNASQIESLLGTPGYGINAAANSYLQSIGMQPTAGWNAYGSEYNPARPIGSSQAAQLGEVNDMLNSGIWDNPLASPTVPSGAVPDFSPTQTIEVTAPKLPPSTAPIVVPPTIPSAAQTAQPTPSKGTAPAEEPEQPSLGSKFTDFLKNNPRLALTMLGMLGGAGGGNNNPSPGSAGGAQSNLTATQAPKFQRQYVAPPEGYRPGFDPEHKYFTGIGSTGG